MSRHRPNKVFWDIHFTQVRNCYAFEYKVFDILCFTLEEVPEPSLIQYLMAN
jgi:hypothetical protein